MLRLRQMLVLLFFCRQIVFLVICFETIVKLGYEIVISIRVSNTYTFAFSILFVTLELTNLLVFSCIRSAWKLTLQSWEKANQMMMIYELTKCAK